MSYTRTMLELLERPEGHPLGCAIALMQVRRVSEEAVRAAETQTYNLDCLARDAISLAEHLLPYAPRGEKAQLYQALTELRAAVNAEMGRQVQ